MMLSRTAFCMLAFLGGVHTAAAQKADNGTDPTKLRRMIWTSYEHMDLGHGTKRGLFKLMYESPITD